MKRSHKIVLSALAMTLLGTVSTAHALFVVADFDGDGVHDPQVSVFAGTTIEVVVYASQTPAETNLNGGLTGFGLFMDTDGLPLADNSIDAVEINPAWNFVTQQSVVDPAGVELRVVGNTLTAGGFSNEQVQLFTLSVDVPNLPFEVFEVSFSDAENASFVTETGFVYDDVAVFLPNTVKIIPVPDSDNDGINDLQDNCILQANPGQQDADADGIGNLCDADLNQDCSVNFEDLGLLRVRFFTNDPAADFDSSGVVNAVDLGIMRTLFFASPGPSGQPNLCSGT